MVTSHLIYFFSLLLHEIRERLFLQMRPHCTILSPTAILGYSFPPESFARGISCTPDLIAVDAGSTDPGPFYLGSGKSFTNRASVKRDLRYILSACVNNKILVVIGSAGGAGAAPHLAWCRAIILELAKEEGLAFRLGVIPTDVSKDVVHAALDADKVRPLECVPPLTHDIIDDTSHIVAQVGVEPFIEALEGGAQVILAGRAYDPACFAALPILKGFDPALALHCGKILECAAIAASPSDGADCVLGTIYDDSFTLQALSGERKFTAESTAAHSLYEKADPYHLPGPGGVLDLKKCSFTEIENGMVRVKGSMHRTTVPYSLKLEGARQVGFRTVAIGGTRDLRMIGDIDQILADVRKRVEDRLAEAKARIFFRCYGRDGVMGFQEPRRTEPNHELGIFMEVVADTQSDADAACALVRSTLLHHGYRGRVSTAGNLALPLSPSDISAGPVYEFSIYHLWEPPAGHPFPCHFEQVGGSN